MRDKTLECLMLPQGSTTSTAVMTNTKTKTKINTNFLVKPKKNTRGSLLCQKFQSEPLASILFINH